MEALTTAADADTAGGESVASSSDVVARVLDDTGVSS